MIYGYINNVVKEQTSEPEVVSVVYEEFCNYRQMLEDCTDESARPILEAQVQVLYEVSISDIIEKIKEIWESVVEFIKKIWNKIFHNKKIVEEREKEINVSQPVTIKAVEKVNEEIKTATSGEVKLNVVSLKIPKTYKLQYTQRNSDNEKSEDIKINFGKIDNNMLEKFVDLNAVNAIVNSNVADMSELYNKLYDFNVNEFTTEYDDFSGEAGIAYDQIIKYVRQISDIHKEVINDSNRIEQYKATVDDTVNKYSRYIKEIERVLKYDSSHSKMIKDHRFNENPSEKLNLFTKVRSVIENSSKGILKMHTETLVVRDKICSQHKKIISALRTVAKNNNWDESKMDELDRLIRK